MKSNHSIDIHENLDALFAPLVQMFMRSMKQHDISMPQVHALMYIYHMGECQVSDIGTLAGVSKAAASQLVDRLVQQGLVERKEHSLDRRTKVLKLSNKGMDLIKEGLTADNFMVEMLASLTPEQQKTVHDAIAILAQAARRFQVARKEKDNEAQNA